MTPAPTTANFLRETAKEISNLQIAPWHEGRLHLAAEELESQQAEIETLRAALKIGVGCTLNELAQAKLPLEWTPDAGLGTMLKALGCSSTKFDESVRKLLEPEKRMR